MKCKLTDEKGQTYGGCQWGPGITHTAEGKGKVLCSDGVIHYYEDALLAVFANPLHANFATPILWEFKPLRKVSGDALKSACKTGTTIRQVPLPELTTLQRVEIGIRCAMLVCKDKVWMAWAEKWLSEADRSAYAADAARAADAAYAAYYAADAARAAAATRAAYAADAARAADAAYAAFYAADAARAAYAADAAADAILKIIREVANAKRQKGGLRPSAPRGRA